MGVVYLAYDVLLDRRVALKLVKHRHGNRARQTRTLREAQALARVSHPNVVQVHDVGEFEHRVYLAMEYVNGVSLRRWLRDAKEGRAVSEVLRAFIDAGRGLAAVHEAGLVHRDFKMENVLVDGSGRARVADFGLAAARVLELEPRPAAAVPLVSALGLSLTTSGAVLGTPKSMAPEQFLGRTVDARSDQFSFCVALHSALYGAPPFVGESFAELKEAVTSGRLRAPNSVAPVPPWIAPILERGLATDPADRYPSMHALLEDLSSDPVARRRQRLRAAALIVGTITVVLLGVYGGQQARARWQRSELEARAAKHLARVEVEMTRLRDAQEHAQADRLFEDFSALTEYQGTRTLTNALIRRASAQAEDRDYRGARDSLSRAYIESSEPALAYEALIELAELLVKQHRWTDAERTLNAATALEPARSGGSRDRLTRLGIDIALASLDFTRAAALAADGPEDLRWLAPIATNLTRATRTEHHLRSNWLPILHEPERAWIYGQEPSIVRLDRALTRIGPAPRGKILVSSTYQQGREHFIVGFDEAVGVSTLYRSVGEGVEPVLVLERPQADAIELADLDGDGHDELYLGGDSLTAMQRSADGTWRTWEPHPESVGLNCGIAGLQAVDLDDDGRRELIASCGAWDAYDVRVYEHDAASMTLRLRARRMFGTVKGVTTLRRASGGLVLLAPKLQQYESSVMFPSDHPLGGPPGIYLLRLEGDALVLDERLELPRSVNGDPQPSTYPLVGDVDGDGLEDFFVRAWARTSSGERDYAHLFRQRADGSFSRHTFRDINVLALANVDDDPSDEWLVTHLGRDRSLWWFGIGDEPSPVEPVTIDDPAGSSTALNDADPVFSRLWTRADTLRGLGLEVEAAGAFERLASLATTPSLRRAAWTRAAQVYSSRGADSEAARLYELVASVSDDPGARLEAARSYRRAGEYVGALRVLEPYTRGRGGAVGDELERLRDHLRALVRERALVLDFDRGLPPGLAVERPQSLAIVPERHVLRVQSLGGRTASYPVNWDGRELVMTADVELRRGEYDSSFAVALRGDGLASAPSLMVGAWGGAGRARYLFSTETIAHRAPRLHSDRNGRWRVRIRLSYIADEQRARLVVQDRDTGALVHERSLDALDGLREFPPGTYSLELRAKDDDTGLFEIDVERLEVLGVTAAGAEEAGNTVARALVSGRSAAALRELGPTRADDSTRTRAHRLLALVQLGRHAEAARAASALLAAPEGEAAARELLQLAPATYLPPLRGAAGDRAFSLLLDVWRERHGANIEVVGHTSALLPALADVDGVEDSRLRGELLVIRGELRMNDGDLGGAREDLSRARLLRTSPGSGALELKLAALAAAVGDEQGAIQYAREFMSSASAPSLAAAMLRARPELAVLEGHPAWEALLGPDDRLLYDE